MIIANKAFLAKPRRGEIIDFIRPLNFLVRSLGSVKFRKNPSGPVSELTEHAVVVPPVLFDFYKEFEVDLTVEKLLDFLS